MPPLPEFRKGDRVTLKTNIRVVHVVGESLYDQGRRNWTYRLEGGEDYLDGEQLRRPPKGSVRAPSTT